MSEKNKIISDRKNENSVAFFIARKLWASPKLVRLARLTTTA